MSNYQLFQFNRYGNILPEDQDPKEEEFEYRHIESRECFEWMTREAENGLNSQD